MAYKRLSRNVLTVLKIAKDSIHTPVTVFNSIVSLEYRGPSGFMKKNYYRAHTKYDAKVMFSAFLSFCSQGGGEGGGPKMKNAQNDMGSPKNALKSFLHYRLPLTRLGDVGGGGGGSKIEKCSEWHGRPSISIKVFAPKLPRTTV